MLKKFLAKILSAEIVSRGDMQRYLWTREHGLRYLTQARDFASWRKYRVTVFWRVDRLRSQIPQVRYRVGWRDVQPFHSYVNLPWYGFIIIVYTAYIAHT